MRNIVWFRRDLRIGDHPALIAAMEGADEIVPVFILDKQQIQEAGSKLLPYAVAPGRVLKPSDATPYKVYTPFYKAWCVHGWRAPAKTPK